MTTPNQMQEWKAKMLAERAVRRTTQTPSENKVEDLIDEARVAYERAEKMLLTEKLRLPKELELEWEPEEAQTVYGLPVPSFAVESYNEERHACLALLIDAVGLAVSCYRTTLDGLARDGQEFSIRFPTTHTNARMGNGMRLVEEAVQALWAASSRFEGEGDGCGCEPKRPAHVDPHPTACYHVERIVEEIPVPRADDDQDRR